MNILRTNDMIVIITLYFLSDLSTSPSYFSDLHHGLVCIINHAISKIIEKNISTTHTRITFFFNNGEFRAYGRYIDIIGNTVNASTHIVRFKKSGRNNHVIMVNNRYIKYARVNITDKKFCPKPNEDFIGFKIVSTFSEASFSFGWT